MTGGRYLAERAIVDDADGGARRSTARALAAGHEGVMAKDLAQRLRAGRPRQALVQAQGRARRVDCVIVAADRGSGRRVGWLSNYHLAVRDGEGFAEVGKTFKGLTDARVRRDDRAAAGAGRRRRRLHGAGAARGRGRGRRTTRSRRARPIPSGLALRFARIARIRDDKAPGQATTLDELRGLYERQFATKGRRAV